GVGRGGHAALGGGQVRRHPGAGAPDRGTADRVLEDARRRDPRVPRAPRAVAGPRRRLYPGRRDRGLARGPPAAVRRAPEATGAQGPGGGGPGDPGRARRLRPPASRRPGSAALTPRRPAGGPGAPPLGRAGPRERRGHRRPPRGGRGPVPAGAGGGTRGYRPEAARRPVSTGTARPVVG